MSTATWRRSPVFWGVVAAASGVTGALLWRRRNNLLGQGGSTVRRVGPDPKVIFKNPAKPMTPTQVTAVDGKVNTRYTAPNISINERVRQIQGQIWKGYNDPRMRQLALQLTANCGRDDGPCEIDTIFAAVKQRVRYVQDGGPVLDPKTGVVEPADIYTAPYQTWVSRGGDCGNQVSLVATMLALLGHEVRLRVTAPGKFGPHEHVYGVVGVNSKTQPTRWMAVDTTLPGPRMTAGGQARYGRALDYALEVPA